MPNIYMYISQAGTMGNHLICYTFYHVTYNEQWHLNVTQQSLVLTIMHGSLIFLMLLYLLHRSKGDQVHEAHNQISNNS